MIKAIGAADPQKLGEELARIRDKNNGELTPADALEEARNKRSPLHPHVEWDDKKAAHKFRLDQMREIISIIRQDDDEAPSGKVRSYVSVTEKGGTAYRGINEIKSNLELQVIVLKQAERDLKAWEDRYRDLVDICEVVKQAREKVRKRRITVETRAAAQH